MPRKQTHSAMAAFSNFNLPCSYVIDRDGHVRLAWMGYGQPGHAGQICYASPTTMSG